MPWHYIMPGKCTSAWALEFVPKISYLYLFVRVRGGLKWPVNGKGGTARFVTLYFHMFAVCTIQTLYIYIHVYYIMHRKGEEIVGVTGRQI